MSKSSFRPEKSIGDLLLRGYKMLSTSCNICNTVLMQSKSGETICVTCENNNTSTMSSSSNKPSGDETPVGPNPTLNPKETHADYSQIIEQTQHVLFKQLNLCTKRILDCQLQSHAQDGEPSPNQEQSNIGWHMQDSSIFKITQDNIKQVQEVSSALKNLFELKVLLQQSAGISK